MTTAKISASLCPTSPKTSQHKFLAGEIRRTNRDTLKKTLSLIILDCPTFSPLLWSARRSLGDCWPSPESQTAATGSGPRYPLPATLGQNRSQWNKIKHFTFIYYTFGKYRILRHLLMIPKGFNRLVQIVNKCLLICSSILDHRERLLLARLIYLLQLCQCFVSVWPLPASDVLFAPSTLRSFLLLLVAASVSQRWKKTQNQQNDKGSLF